MNNPSKPSPPDAPTRRSFFQWLTVGMGVMAAVVTAIPFIGYLIGPLRKREPIWMKL